jgi:SH3-like domain-containing protein
MIKVLVTLLLSMIHLTGYADNKKLPVPRFASIKSNEVNARAGPSIKSPIEWVFIKKGEPIEIVAEYEQWRQIIDLQGEGGWVHSSVLSGKRFVVAKGKDELQLVKDPNEINLRVTAKLKPQVRCQLNKCKDKWCKVKCKNVEGWIQKKSLWGVYAHEEKI